MTKSHAAQTARFGLITFDAPYSVWVVSFILCTSVIVRLKSCEARIVSIRTCMSDTLSLPSVCWLSSFSPSDPSRDLNNLLGSQLEN